MSPGEGPARLAVIPIEGVPEIAAGDELGALLTAGASLEPGDVVVVSQKAVSKAEGRTRTLAAVMPSAEARKLAAELGKEPNLVELILEESAAVLRAERGILITETKHGFVCANAGIDSSNLPGDDTVCLLPENPDGSARRLRLELQEQSGVAPLATIVADSFGRAWRLGQAEVAIGCAGIEPLDDWRGRADASGRELEATAIAVADQAAGAADLVRAKDGGVPAAIVRGIGRFVTAGDGPGAAALRRPRGEDLFR